MLTLCNFRLHETSLILLTKSNFIDAVLPIIWQLTPRGLVNWGAALGRYTINHHFGMIQVSKSVSRPSYIYISRPSYIFGFRILARWTAVIQIVPVYMCVDTAVGLLFLTDLIIYKLRLLLIPSETTTANRQSTHIVILDACFLTG